MAHAISDGFVRGDVSWYDMKRLSVAAVVAAILVLSACGGSHRAVSGGPRYHAVVSDGSRFRDVRLVAEARGTDLRAFQRPASPSDVLPSAFLPLYSGRYGLVVASRRIATETGFRGQSAVYLARLKQQRTCLIQTIRDSSAGGAECLPSREFLRVKRPVRANEGGRFLYGVVANNIARVGFRDPRGNLRPVRLTRDGGFLYACRHHNGCVGLVSAVNGYDRQGRLVFHERL